MLRALPLSIFERRAILKAATRGVTPQARD
jgi:hypothetical protein